ncbi:hypothetical protein V6R21_15015 [Limibacter armeniacum]|uniref:hypothetical protein n=1 Tax=Limibacter armeniacum TaxID=466084 RepID=UPI002FE66A22
MKLKQKVVIDFKEFLTTAKFDYLKIGDTKEWVLNNFPDPDSFDEYPDMIKDDIWRYGNIELHFHNEALFLIYSDYIQELNGGDSLDLKKWFLEDIQKLTLLDVISIFNKNHVDYCKKTYTTGQTTVTLDLSSGVKLGFSLEEADGEDTEGFYERSKSSNQDIFMLTSFSLMGS